MSRVMHQFLSFLALPASERRLAISLCFRLRRLRRDLAADGSASLLCLEEGVGSQTTQSIDRARHLARIVNGVAAFALTDRTCLVRSLALAEILDREGIGSRLRIGALANKPFDVAHAWVEVGGIPVNDRGETVERYVPFELMIEQDHSR